MPIIKFVPQRYDSLEALNNLCAYVVDYEKTRGAYGGRGIIVSNAYETMVYVQRLWAKDWGRLAYHMILSFDDLEALVPWDAMNIAFQVSSLFFPRYQILYGVHVTQEHLHIHFVINPVSLIDGKKLHIGYTETELLKSHIAYLVTSYVSEMG